MRVYISGPIKGRRNGNREAFEKAAARMREQGHEAVNPHEVDASHRGRECTGDELPKDLAGPAEHQYGCYLRADIRAMLDCDAILVLDGWTASQGAMAEMNVAKLVGMEILYP